MTTIGICGSAGRNGEMSHVSRELFFELFDEVVRIIGEFQIPSVKCISGGSSFCDHIAVHLFLTNQIPELELALPCKFVGGKFDQSTCGKRLNDLHAEFSVATGFDSLNEIAEAVEKGATVTVFNGFEARNKKIASCQHLIAASFGNQPTGGTLQTWTEYMKLTDRTASKVGKREQAGEGYFINLKDAVSYH